MGWGPWGQDLEEEGSGAGEGVRERAFSAGGQRDSTGKAQVAGGPGEDRAWQGACAAGGGRREQGGRLGGREGRELGRLSEHGRSSQVHG